MFCALNIPIVNIFITFAKAQFFYYAINVTQRSFEVFDKPDIKIFFTLYDSHFPFSVSSYRSTVSFDRDTDYLKYH